MVLQGEVLVVAVDEDGLFTERITHFSGRYVKDADKDIIEAVKVITDTQCSFVIIWHVSWRV